MRPLCPPRRSSFENVGRSGHRTGAAARRSRRGPATLRTLVAVIAALPAAPASDAAAFPVGHTVKRIIVPGTLAHEVRAVDVQLWYPADAASFAGAATTVYRSALYGDTRIPAGWKPLSWSVNAKLSREAAISQQGTTYPV